MLCMAYMLSANHNSLCQTKLNLILLLNNSLRAYPKNIIILQHLALCRTCTPMSFKIKMFKLADKLFLFFKIVELMTKTTKI